MIRKWITGVFWASISASDDGGISDSQIAERYAGFLESKLAAARPQLLEAFRALFSGAFPLDLQRLHFEIFEDEPGFGFGLFLLDAGNTEVFANELTNPFQAAVDGVWPLVTDSEMDQFMIWEDDPKWGRQHALDQPLDAFDVMHVARPWFRSIVSETKGSFAPDVTLGVHDRGRDVSL